MARRMTFFMEVLHGSYPRALAIVAPGTSAGHRVPPLRVHRPAARGHVARAYAERGRRDTRLAGAVVDHPSLKPVAVLARPAGVGLLLRRDEHAPLHHDGEGV